MQSVPNYFSAFLSSHTPHSVTALFPKYSTYFFYGSILSCPNVPSPLSPFRFQLPSFSLFKALFKLLFFVKQSFILPVKNQSLPSSEQMSESFSSSRNYSIYCMVRWIILSCLPTIFPPKAGAFLLIFHTERGSTFSSSSYLLVLYLLAGIWTHWASIW